MLLLAWKNLFQSKTQFLLGIGGVTLALLLMLGLDSLLTGSENDLVAYIEQSGADIFVAQKGVKNMHMASSAIQDSDVRMVAQIEGVESASPILYATSIIETPDQDVLSYIIGFDPRYTLGGPQSVIAGRTEIRSEEVIIDDAVARSQHIQLGDEVDIFGETFTVVGITKGLTNIVNSVAFIYLKDFEDLRPGDSVSYGLLEVQAGYDPEAIAAEIMARDEDVNALTQADFSREERAIIRDMSVDILNVMNFSGFLIGLAVTALTLYTSTLNKRQEYGVLKAVGASNRHLYLVVAIQASISLTIGFIIAVAFVALLGIVLPSFVPGVGVALSPTGVIRVIISSLIIGVVSAGIPAVQIAQLDPAIVFRS